MKIERPCTVCGKVFFIPPCRDRIKTCSIKCGGIFRRGKKWELKERIIKECLNCKTLFKVIPNKTDKQFCTRKCYLSLKCKNVKHPDRQRFQGSKWIKIRKEIIKRDKNCVLCHNPGKEVHHKVPYSMTADDSLKNLVLLCRSCHLSMHNVIWKAEKLDYKVVYDKSGRGLFLTLELK